MIINFSSYTFSGRADHMPAINAPYDGTDNATNYISVNFIYLLTLPSLISALPFPLIPSLLLLMAGLKGFSER